MIQNEQKVCQNDEKVIQCDRCSNTFCNITNLRRHFNNKKLCKPILKNISIEELKEKYKVRKGCYKCENCGKEYKSKSGKYKHKKNCLINCAIIEKKENSKLKIELNKEVLKRKELQKQVEELLLEKSKIQEHQTNIINSNNTTNNDNRVTNINIINNFGEENIEYLLKDENFIKKCIESPINSIHRYLDNVHFNKEHPENTNIKITNLLGPYMDYVKGGKWKKIEKNILLPKIINKSIDVVDEIAYYDLNSDSEDDDNLNKWDKYSDIKDGENKKLKDKIIKKATRHIYNKTNDTIQT